MTSVVTVKNDMDRVNNVILDFAKNVTPMIFATEQKRVTVNLTKAGLGADGKSMPKLSGPYARFKRRGTGKAIRDMRLYGDMIKSLHIQKGHNGQGWLLRFGDDQQKKVLGNQAYAEFFGINVTALRFAEVEVIKQFNALR